MKTLQLVIFTDSSFANNKDISSQIGFIICLADTISTTNIIYWSFIKCKQVTCIVLMAELYRMAHKFNIRAVIKAMLRKMFESTIPLILYIDLKSLYNCLVRLGTIQEK